MYISYGEQYHDYKLNMLTEYLPLTSKWPATKGLFPCPKICLGYPSLFVMEYYKNPELVYIIYTLYNYNQYKVTESLCYLVYFDYFYIVIGDCEFTITEIPSAKASSKVFISFYRKLEITFGWGDKEVTLHH